MGKLGCGLYLIGYPSLCGSHRREREHGDLGLVEHESLPGLCRRVGDLDELLCGRIYVESGVGKDERALLAELLLGRAHDEEGRYELGIRGGLEDLQRGAQGACRRVTGAGDQAVSIAHLDHHHAKVYAVVHRLARLDYRDALTGAELGKLLGVCLMLVRVPGVYDGRTGDIIDLVWVAEDHDFGDMLIDDHLGRLNDSRIVSLGKDDGLLVGLRCVLDAFDPLTHAHSNR